MKSKWLASVMCLALFVCMLFSVSATAAASAAGGEDIRVVWSGVERLSDINGGNFWYTGTYSTGANGQLYIWRPTSLQSEAMGDNAHFKITYSLDMTKYPYFYVEMEEDSPVELTFQLSNTMGTYTALSAQKLEAGRVYKLRWENNEKPGKAAEFMAGEMTYDLQVIAHFKGAFSDETKVKIKYAYFGDEELTRVPAQGNEAVKLDYAGAMMDSATDLTINDDLSMLVQSEFDGTYCFHKTFYVNLEETPYIYVDIEGCYGGDVWFLDFNDLELGTNCRPLGFIGIGEPRQVFRVKIADWLERLKHDPNETEQEINISFIRTDSDEVNPVTLNGIYLGDEYFNYEGIDALAIDTPVDEKVTPAFTGGGLSATIWILIGGGIVLVVLIVAFIVMAMLKKKKSAAKENE